MKEIKFSKIKMCVIVLASVLMFNACKDSSTSAIYEEKMEITTYMSNDLMPKNTVSSNLIETLDVDARLVGSPGGPAISTNILESGVEYRITVDGNWSAWPQSWWECTSPYPTKYLSPAVLSGTNAGFNAEWRYANAGDCGITPYKWTGLKFSLDAGLNYFDPTPIDDAFNADHIYEYEVTGVGQKVAFLITDTNEDNHGVLKVTIEEITAPEVTNNVYISDSSVQTWDPIFPASADPNWSSTVCYQDNTFGLNANWVNPHNAFEVTQDNGQPHSWDNSTFDAAWINSYNDMDSEGPGGHNWSKYETDVAGNGDFVIQLLADNCSWVYLSDEDGNNPQLIGYQPAVSTPGEYGVTLDGAHKLTFVIFDGGGLAGGKFRLETTESFGGTPPPPIATNSAPVADAGENQTVTATGQTTAVTLDGSNSSDPDGDALTYAWSNGATGATPTVNLPDGTHTLTLTVSDGEASDTDEVTITVVNTVPVADAGSNQTKEATGPTTTVTLSGSGTDADGDALTYSWSNGDAGASTTVDLTVGVHTFTLMVSDGQGASDTDEVTIEITDTTAPVLSFTQETNSLWPPNHKMVLVASGISASDIVDGSTAVEVTVSSNELPNGKGDGNTAIDYEVVTNFDGSKDVYVRAERSGKGSGRTYTISLSTSDVAGNSSSKSFEVSTNKSQGNDQIKATGKKNK